jgi:hypothetical protein
LKTKTIERLTVISVTIEWPLMSDNSPFSSDLTYNSGDVTYNIAPVLGVIFIIWLVRVGKEIVI